MLPFYTFRPIIRFSVVTREIYILYTYHFSSVTLKPIPRCETGCPELRYRLFKALTFPAQEFGM